GRNFAAHFKEKFGITVNPAFLTAAPGLERFRSESQSGNHIADIFNTTDGTLMLQAMSDGLIAGYKTQSYGDFPANWIMEKNGGITYPTSRAEMTIMYNTALVAADEREKLATWDGLLDP